MRRIVLRIENAGPAAMTCHAQLAHWYSAVLGQGAPGAGLVVALWHDPARGSLEMLNADAVRMPVEAVTCGPPGDPHAARLALPFGKGAMPGEAPFRCAPAAGGFACVPVDRAQDHNARARPAR